MVSRIWRRHSLRKLEKFRDFQYSQSRSLFPIDSHRRGEQASKSSILVPSETEATNHRTEHEFRGLRQLNRQCRRAQAHGLWVQEDPEDDTHVVGEPADGSVLVVISTEDEQA